MPDLGLSIDVHTHNRYALFTDGDSDVSPTDRPVVDVSRNAFLNQVGDDSIPWQEAKKGKTRGDLPVQAGLQAAVKPILKDHTRAILNETLTTRNRVPATISSSSAASSSDKTPDPYENWCGVCSKKLSTKAALLAHIKQSPDHEHYCNLCKRVFKDRNGLKNHVDNSVGHETFCNLCLSAFRDEWGLKNHFENNYHVGHEFVCLTCLLGFRSSSSLERHLQTAEKHTWCTTCHHRFRNQNERDEHWQKTISKSFSFIHRRSITAVLTFESRAQTLLASWLRLRRP